MKTCICTVIKNEHQYLDEWIQYHLNLGIDFIFIFEDIDSDSHKNITDKYPQVSLMNIREVFNEDEEHIISKIKTKEIKGHKIYFKNALDYIIKNYDYDWCFLIDIDEFITLENNNYSLNEIVSMYSEYDAFLLRWKCFGAGGIIKTPDYTKLGVVDVFTKPMTGYILDRPTSFNKTCYNLKKLNDDIYRDHHRPKYECNWVNADFQKDPVFNCYKNIYLRHYITKSWEEYVWKKNSRGFVWAGGGRRKGFDFFFFINPELLPLKDELLESLN